MAVFSNVEGDSVPFPYVYSNDMDKDFQNYLNDLGLADSNPAGTAGSANATLTGTGQPMGTTGMAKTLQGGGVNFNPYFFPGANTNNLAPTDFAALTTAAEFSDHAGLGPRNAGRNPVVRAKLQLNGHDRFQERLGSYFNLVQPYQHHTNVPPTGINVYSFGLKPEEHQPSGTCNMSRIDNCTLLP
jgi:hypothetical protein